MKTRNIRRLQWRRYIRRIGGHGYFTRDFNRSIRRQTGDISRSQFFTGDY